MINYTDNAGTYNVDGIFSYGGDVYIIRTSFDVINTFHAEIEANRTTGEPTDTFHFESNATGGIGGVTYEWDFGDGDTATGDSVDHNYSKVGDYEVELTATDGKGNKVTDTISIRVYNRYNVHVIVKELQTQKLLEGIPVEIDDERKHTNSDGEVNFSVYEGKRRLYVADEGYEWVKQVLNITADSKLVIELNNTAITNYTPRQANDSSGTGPATQEEQDTQAKAEQLLAQASSALETLESDDQATKELIEALDVEGQLKQAKKILRQAIRDIGNLEKETDMTQEQRQSRLSNITARIEELDDTIISLEIQDTTEFVDYPKTSDVSMISAEYLKYKNIEYSKRQKERYSEGNMELQDQITINTRLAVAEIEQLSGNKKIISAVINKLVKSPVDTQGKSLIEYIPKEVASSAAEITGMTEYDVVKSDPILRFSPDIEKYAYYIQGEASIDNLKKTKHVLIYEPEEQGPSGLTSVTGFSFLPQIKIENPRLVAQVVLIILLLIAYISYHFELLDRFRDWRKEKKSLYTSDTAYKPESTIQSMTRKVAGFVKKEDELIMREISHIKSLILTAHSHTGNSKHDQAAETYTQIMQHYKTLSPQAKAHIHPETKNLFNSMLLSKVNNLINEAFVHLSNQEHKKARNHYSEIKKLYTRLEKEHRAAVSEKCMHLHAKIFETSLT
jgi:PKD repeat protein